MGIPKFYRWLSERYPLLNQRFTATEGPPEIDNLYLDMNGIIHNCTHANQKEVKLSEDDMMLRIFDYIDKLVQVMRPRKLLFMAIDGVAPRAKMNQQRSRRFKSARERLEAQAEKERKGEPVPSDPFDSNCITPGTPFMERLGRHLRFFIRRKMSEDPLWQQPTVIFSGHDVPGEGEHKIMEYIRWEKKSASYVPNQRHCLYGLDADLIMLSLVTHEPHFCLLREIVSYTGGNRGQPAREVLENPCAENFILFHIGLLREYMELEFKGLSVPFEPSGQVDVERIVDDFVLFCMLIGNDFLPALPTLDINEGALNAIISIYKELLGSMGGYLTYGGELDRSRLEKLLVRLGAMEQEVLEERAKDAEYFEGKRNKKNGADGAWVAPSLTRAREQATNGNGSTAGGTSNGAVNGAVPVAPSGGTALPGAVRQAAGPDGGAGFGGPQHRKAAAAAKAAARLQEIEGLDGVDVSAAEMAGLSIGQAAEGEGDGVGIDKELGNGETNGNSAAAPERHPSPLAAFFKVIGNAGADLAVVAALEEEAVEPVVPETIVAEPTMMSKEARQLMLSGQGAEGLQKWKDRWYQDKLEAKTAADQRRVVECYLQGLHWVLEYYYRGVASWDWYYPYHYAPMASDLVQLEAIPVRFVQGTPFKPYEQLLSVLPAASAPLLPLAYRALMLDPQSPVLDFYPADFKVDMEGKRASWEGVVLIPFVNEARLLAAIRQIGEAALTPDERARNILGDILIFTHNEASKDTEFCNSTMPKLYRDVTEPRSRLVRRKMPPPLPPNEKGFMPLQVPGTLTGLSAPKGFPTLKSIQVKACLRNAGVNVLGTASRKESLLLVLPDVANQQLTVANVAPKLLGMRCYVNWPYLQEATIMRVSDKVEQWYHTGHSAHQQKKWQSQEATKWGSDCNVMASALLTRHGLDVGKVQLVLHVRVCKGYIRHMDGSLEKQYSQDEVEFPLQCVLRTRPQPPTPQGGAAVARPGTAEDQPPSIEIKEGDKVIYLGKSHYGCVATVLPALGQGMSKKGKPIVLGGGDGYRVSVQPLGPGGQDPGARPAHAMATRYATRYFPSGDVARKLRIDPRVLGRITTNVWVNDNDERWDLGLSVRSPGKGLCVPTFCAPASNGNGWQYSQEMMSILSNYRAAHPWLWDALKDQVSVPDSGPTLRLADLLPDVSPQERRERCIAAALWVKNSPLAGKALVKTSVELMSDEGVKMLQLALPPAALCEEVQSGNAKAKA